MLLISICVVRYSAPPKPIEIVITKKFEPIEKYTVYILMEETGPLRNQSITVFSNLYRDDRSNFIRYGAQILMNILFMIMFDKR